MSPRTLHLFSSLIRPPPRPTLFPYTTLFRSVNEVQIMNFEKRYGNPCVRLRFFNAYGPGEYYHNYRSRTHRSEEHTSELQSHHDLVCRLLLEKKKKKRNN